jgi:hypothetical protein
VFFDHLQDIVRNPIAPAELAANLPIKFTQKFDAFLPDELLDYANGRDQLDLEKARHIAKQELLTTTCIL